VEAEVRSASGGRGDAHWPEDDRSFDETFEAFHRLLRAGKIRSGA
jgi:hypothetical protein